MKQNRLKNMLFFAIVNIFTILTIFFFSPMEIYLGNVIEFDISINLAIIILFAFSSLSCLILSLLETFLPEQIGLNLNLAMFGLGISFYVQSMFLNGEMGTLTGEGDNYQNSLLIINLGCWILISIILFFVINSKKYIKKESSVAGIKYISVVLIVMQLVGFVSLYVATDKSINAFKNTYFTSEGEFELSDKKNVVYFIIDTCDGATVERTLQAYPDMYEGYNGFTYYPNATTTYSRTYPSVVYLLTGQKCYFDKPYAEYVNEAYEKGNFIDDIDDLGTNICLYTENAYVGQSALDKIDNLVVFDNNKLSSINISGFLKQTLKVSCYRGMPYVLKESFRYSAEEVNYMSMKEQPAQAKVFDDLDLYNRILNNEIYVNEKMDATFKFYHMTGVHPGCSINENAEYEEGVSYTDCLRGNIKIIEAYIDNLKRNGIFEETLIIITTDHGSSNGGNDDLRLDDARSGIMLVKPAGVDDTNMLITSFAPVAHEDLFATVIDGLGGNMSSYGKPVYAYVEGEERDRYYYNTSLFSDEDGEIALREYLVRGDARYIENYYLTGNNWDIIYSQRAVSTYRLPEELKINEVESLQE